MSSACSRRSCASACSSPTTPPSSSSTKRCSTTGRGSSAGSTRTRTAVVCTGSSRRRRRAGSASGREAGELYRGARLAAALEWADATGADAGLNRLEREFLQASRTASTRATRRLRALLAAALVLLVAALAAGALALQARGTARHRATAAIAQRLGAQALVEPALDRALLLAREGVALDDSVPTRSNLLAALLRSPAALAVLHGGGTRVQDAALGADGRTLAVRADDGSVAFFDLQTLREHGPRFQGSGKLGYCGAIGRPVHALALSPDGHTLAAGDQAPRRAPRRPHPGRHPVRIARPRHACRHVRRPRTSCSRPTAGAW